MEQFRGTTIVAVKKDGKTVIAGDGQVTMGQSVILKGSAHKVRRLFDGKVVVGFAGGTADAFAMCEEFEKMLEFAINLKRPVAIRYPRGGEGKVKFDNCDKINLGKAEVIKKGTDLTIIAIGKMVERAVEVSNLLEKDNVNAEIINARFLKPLDKEIILSSVRKTKKAITIEDRNTKRRTRNNSNRINKQ